MRSKEVIDEEIETLRFELKNISGRPIEVYQRITGYYRQIKSWNLGKAEEYRHRKVFTLPSICDCKDSMV